MQFLFMHSSTLCIVTYGTRKIISPKEGKWSLQLNIVTFNFPAFQCSIETEIYSKCMFMRSRQLFKL